MARTAPWQPPSAPENQTRVDHLFLWLVQCNERLLDFMGPQRLMHLCLSKRGAVQLSMHPRRAEIIKCCAREIGHFLAEVEAFLAGYKQLLMLGTASDDPEYGQCRDELTSLGEQLAKVRQWVGTSLAMFTQPFSTNAELPCRDSNLQHWLHSCQQLSEHLLRQVVVRRWQDINSVHQLVLWLHQRFLAMLAPVASTSGQGLVQTGLLGTEDCITFVDFTPAPVQQLLNKACYNALMASSASRVTVLIMPDYVQMAIQLQNHACSIELLTQAEGGKARTLRLRYGEDFAGNSHKTGMWLRLWYLAQTLVKSPPTASLGAPDIVYNDQSHQILCEFTRIPSLEVMQGMFIDMLAVLHSLGNKDLYWGEFHLDGCQTVWSMSAIRERLTNPAFAKTNEQALAHAYWLVGYRRTRESLRTPWTHNKALAHLEVTADIFRHASNSRIDRLLRAQTDSHRRTVLWHFLLSDPPRAAPWVRQWALWLNDEATAMRLVSHNGLILGVLEPQLRNKRAVVMAAIKCHPEALAHAPVHFKNDLDIVSLALRNGLSPDAFFDHIGSTLLDDPVIYRQLVTLAVTCNSLFFQYLDEGPELDRQFLNELFLLANKRTRRVCLTSLSICKGMVDSHQLYRQMIIDSLKQGRGMDDLARLPEFQNDREVVELSLNCDPFNLEFASARLRGDRALVRQAVAIDGRALKYAGDTLRDDFDLVLIAVKKRGAALAHASKRLQGNPDIVTAALQRNGSALVCASESIRTNPDFARLAVSNQKLNDDISSYLPPSFYGDKALMVIALKRNYKSFRFVSRGLRNDTDLVSMVLNDHGEQLEHASARLRGDRDVVCLAVASKGKALEHADESLRADSGVVELALRNDGMALQYVHKQLRTHTQIVAIAVQQNGLALEFAPAGLRSDKPLVTLALHNNGQALRFADPSLWDDPDIIAAAVDSIGPVAVENIRLDILPGLGAFKLPQATLDT